jgi:hypothetical protein
MTSALPPLPARLGWTISAEKFSRFQRRQLVPMLSRRARSMYDFLKGQFALRAEPWISLWHKGHGAAWFNDADWIGQRQEHWTKILLS